MASNNPFECGPNPCEHECKETVKDCTIFRTYPNGMLASDWDIISGNATFGEDYAGSSRYMRVAAGESVIVRCKTRYGRSDLAGYTMRFSNEIPGLDGTTTSSLQMLMSPEAEAPWTEYLSLKYTDQIGGLVEYNGEQQGDLAVNTSGQYIKDLQVCHGFDTSWKASVICPGTFTQRGAGAEDWGVLPEVWAPDNPYAFLVVTAVEKDVTVYGNFTFSISFDPVKAPTCLHCAKCTRCNPYTLYPESLLCEFAGVLDGTCPASDLNGIPFVLDAQATCAFEGYAPPINNCSVIYFGPWSLPAYFSFTWQNFWEDEQPPYRTSVFQYPYRSTSNGYMVWDFESQQDQLDCSQPLSLSFSHYYPDPGIPWATRYDFTNSTINVTPQM